MKPNGFPKPLMPTILLAVVATSFYSVSFAKDIQETIIKSYGNEIFRTCAFFSLYPVCEFKNGRGKTTFTLKKPAIAAPAPHAPSGSRPASFCSYNVTHVEGFGAEGKTYHDTFELKWKFDAGSVSVAELADNTPVSIYFNGVTINSTIGEGTHSASLGDGVSGGYSVFRKNDSLTKSRFELSLRWTSDGKVLGTFKGSPLKSASKYEKKFTPISLTEQEKQGLDGKTVQTFSSFWAGPVLAVTLGSAPVKSVEALPYTGYDKSRRNCRTGETAETWRVKGKTACAD